MIKQRIQLHEKRTMMHNKGYKAKSGEYYICYNLIYISSYNNLTKIFQSGTLFALYKGKIKKGEKK